MAVRPAGDIDQAAEAEAVGAFARARARVLRTRGEQARRELARRSRVENLAEQITTLPPIHPRIAELAEQITAAFVEIRQLAADRATWVDTTRAELLRAGGRQAHGPANPQDATELWAVPVGYGRAVGAGTRRVDAPDADRLLSLVLRRALPDGLPRDATEPLTHTPRSAPLHVAIASECGEQSAGTREAA